MVAFFVKYDYSVPAYMDPVYKYINFASIWYDFPDYEDNSPNSVYTVGVLAVCLRDWGKCLRALREVVPALS